VMVLGLFLEIEKLPEGAIESLNKGVVDAF
jgi:hypothetical protein